jgi:O-methyltransferase
MYRKLISAGKDFLLGSRIGLALSPLKGMARFIGNFSDLSIWINKHNKAVPFNDFYKPKRTYTDREKLYKYVAEQNNLQNNPVQYYEFGVASGTSFKWWLKENTNPASVFYGFDTFEGLPEDWHYFKKGDMSHSIPALNDERASFIKGLFQDTFLKFLKTNPPAGTSTKILHMDADLYSSTLFVLTAITPYLNDGDIIFFDEFNVANHEFAAWNDYVRSYYVQYEVLGAVNNYYQIALKFKGISTAS